MYIDLSMSNLSEAIGTAEALEAKSPKNTKSLTILWLSYLQKRNIEKSHFYFNQLKEIFTASGNTFFIDELNRFLAFMSSDQNRLRALAHDISSETKDSLKSSLLLEEAALYLENNEIEKANICIHNALGLEINNYSTAANLIEKSRSQEAKDLFRNLNNIFSLGEPLHQGTLFDTAYELGNKGNYDEALAELTTLLSYDENEIVALLYKGILLLKQQKNEEAKTIFQKLFTLQSKQNYFFSLY